MESKLRNCASPLSASTLVIAAVSVVLPWPKCSIVPTFTCGFVRSNFCFAMIFLLSSSTDTADTGVWPGQRQEGHDADRSRHRNTGALIQIRTGDLVLTKTAL